MHCLVGNLIRIIPDDHVCRGEVLGRIKDLDRLRESLLGVRLLGRFRGEKLGDRRAIRMRDWNAGSSFNRDGGFNGG